MKALNSCDTSLRLGIIDCDIEYPDQERVILPIIGVIGDDGNLEYNSKPKRVTRPTIDLMDEVHFNVAKITHVYTAELYSPRKNLYSRNFLSYSHRELRLRKMVFLGLLRHSRYL